MGDQMKAVFGNIEEIKHFHEVTFYLDLKKCNKDLLRIMQCFPKHITAGNFYIYVVYAMNKKRSDEERNNPAFKSFFQLCSKMVEIVLRSHFKYSECFAITGLSFSDCELSYENPECVNKNKCLLYERNNYKIDVNSESSLIQQMMTISFASSTKSSESKVSPRITRDLESVIGSIKRSASSDSLDVFRDQESNTTYVENRKTISDESSIDSAEFGGSQSDDQIEKEQFKQMIKNLDRFYEKAATKIQEPATTRVEIITISVQETYADIIQEMLTNERDYISQLKIGIQTYLTHEHINISEAFRGKISKIFGNLQPIRHIHEYTFQFNLRDCENDLIKIANVFIKFTQEGLFSNYVLYAMNHSNSQTIRNMRPYREFFELRQKDAEDSQGVEYYLYLPLQHLSKYQCIMDRIINTLDINTDRETMAACTKAVKNIECLIKDMQNSWTTPDVQVRKRPISKLSNLVLNGIQNMRKH